MVGTLAVADWDDNYTHQIRVAQYIPTSDSIDDTLDADLHTLLLGPFNAGDTDVDVVQFHRVVYVPLPFCSSCLKVTSSLYRTGTVSGCPLSPSNKKFIVARSSSGSVWRLFMEPSTKY